MAILTVYLLNTAATAPDWFGRVQDNGSAPAGALSAFGWTVAKVALTTPYWRGRIGATARASVAQAASYVDTATGPTKGTGAAATTAGDSYRSDNPLTGTFAAGNWNFTFGMRTGAASNSGRIRLNMWAGPNIDGTSARKLNSATLVGTAVTMSTATTTYNSTVTWAAPQIILDNEYVFLQPEWQSTVVGTSNSCTAQFYQASFVATNFLQVHPFVGISEETLSPVLGEGDLGQKHVLLKLDTAVGSPVLDAPDLAEIVAAGTDDLLADGFTISAPSVGGAALGQAHKLSPTALAVLPPLTIQSSALGQSHKFTAIAIAVQPPTCGAATIVMPPIPLNANDLSATAPSFGTPAMLPIILLTPANLATAPPVEASATLGQKHVLGATAFALTSPPVAAAATFTQQQKLIAQPISIAPYVVGASALGQVHAFTAIALATSNLAIDAATLSQAGVMAAIPPTILPPTLGVGTLGQKHLIAATSAAINPPVLSAASFAQRHLITATIPAFNPAIIPLAFLGQRHALATGAMAVAPPVLGVAAMSQAGVMAAIPAAAGAPVFGAATFGQKHLVVAQPLATTVPVPGSPALGKVLQAAALAAGVPALGSSSLGKVLAAAPLSAGAPALGAPAYARRVFDLTASSLAIGPPVLPALTIGQSGVMAAVPLAAGAPVLGAPAIGQRHVLPAVVGASAGAPAFTGVTFGQKVILVAFTPQVGAPVLGQPGVKQRHIFNSVALAAGSPVCGVGLLGQAGVMAAAPLWLQGPSLPVLALSQRHKLTPLFLGIGVPSLAATKLEISIKLPRPYSAFAGRFKPDPAVLGQAHTLTAQAASAGRPTGLLATFFEGETFPAAPLAVSAPVLGAPALVPVYCFTANVPAPRPVLGAPAIGQRHGFGTVSAQAGRPAITRPRLGAPPHELDTIGLTVEAPIATAAELKSIDRLLAVVGITSRQRLTPITGQRTTTTITARAQSSAPIVGQRNGGVITSRRQRTQI